MKNKKNVKYFHKGNLYSVSYSRPKSSLYFWLNGGLNDNKEPRVSFNVSGVGHTSVTGRYGTEITLQELKQFLKKAKKLYKIMKSLDLKNKDDEQKKSNQD